MSTTTIQLGDHTYRIGKMSALKQFHVVRRLAPMLANVGADFMRMREADNAEAMAEMARPLAEAISALSDDEANYVIFSCLRVVDRQQPDGRYQPVVPGGADALLFDDIDMLVMIRLTAEAVKWNLMGFFDQLGGAMKQG